MSWWEFWKAETPKTSFVQTYIEANADRIPGIRKVDQLNFTVLDTETSGLDPAKDSILSFGGVKISQAKIVVNQAVEWYPAATDSGKKTAAIHGLVTVPNTLSKEDFAKNFLDYIGNSIVVGHHIGFDLEILKNFLKPFGITQLKNPVIDTYHLAIRLEQGPMHDMSSIKKEDYSLDSLCQRYHLIPDDRHTAAGDAFLTAQLFLKLLAKAQSKGITTFQNLIS
ncbi:MAG: 3'-5' exonuclease [Algoriphagus sp.]|nr:3'-5' exonuclease [Algoriphagus sp.]